MREIHYKVRKKGSDPAEYSKGTMYRQWSTKGKTFDTLGKLRSFLTRCMHDDYMLKTMHEFEIVELEVRVHNVKEVHEIVKLEKLVELLKA
jgi:hypothetical protein